MTQFEIYSITDPSQGPTMGYAGKGLIACQNIRNAEEYIGNLYGSLEGFERQGGEITEIGKVDIKRDTLDEMLIEFKKNLTDLVIILRSA